MSDTTRLIIIWGALIFVYLAIAGPTTKGGSVPFVNSIAKSFTDITSALQGR